MTLDPAQQATREKRIAALASVGSAVLLLSLKIFLVARTGSLGILSEAMHSGLDFLAAVITFLSVRVADKPADADHLYGHGKIESFSAFVETALLLFTAVYIIWEAIQRLFFHANTPAPWIASCRNIPAKPSKPTPCIFPPTCGARSSSSWEFPAPGSASVTESPGSACWMPSRL
jgi:divalent metal cation (Fe/Co/Zn/Cd) transporter